MLTIRLAASLFAAALVLAACGKKEEGPFTYTIDGQATEKPAAQAPEVAPPAAPPAATTKPGVPASGNPSTKTNPEFHLPAEAELTTTASGLKYMVIREGQGTKPTPNSNFTAHYCGWFTNGEKFDSSYETGEPLTYPVNRMIKGWQEALTTLLAPGAEYILVVPPDLGYGAGGMGIPPNSTLVFRMELLSVSG